MEQKPNISSVLHANKLYLAFRRSWHESCVTVKHAPLHFCFLQISFYRFLSPEWMQKKVLWRNCKDNPKRNYKSWEKRNKSDKENNRNLQIFYFCSLCLHKEVFHFLLLFILLLPLRNLFRYPNLRKLLKELEKMKEIPRKLWGDIPLKSLEKR